MIRIHGCPRCGGTLERDEAEREWRCWLCGRAIADPPRDHRLTAEERVKWGRQDRGWKRRTE